jgi:SP family arabinose:H+ symporter-like MFS transporter
VALGLDRWAWRWMLGIEALPSLFYSIAPYTVPESPRWLAMRAQDVAALDVLRKANGDALADQELRQVKASLAAGSKQEAASVRELFRPALRRVIVIGVLVGVLQQITGINSVLSYAPMILERSGAGTDASFIQAILVGLVNLVFAVLAISLIDRLGRRPLLLAGLAGIGGSMLLLAYGFAATSLNPQLILVGILIFVASFAMSLGPVMWVLFSELFPNRVRGIAISFVGLINSAVSFLVQLVFPWELARLGNSTTFLIYGMFALAGLPLIMRLLPETKGRSLEELEVELSRR